MHEQPCRPKTKGGLQNAIHEPVTVRSSRSNPDRNKVFATSTAGQRMSGVGRQAGALRLFDAHCHLQDRRIATVAPQLIRTALDSGVQRFAVNGVSEADWHIVKQMGDEYPSIIPCFGLHPWFVAERSPNWFRSLREFLSTTPAASVGEIGLDKGSHGKQIDFAQQVDVFSQQLQLAKELKKPVSVHCVRAFGDLLEIMLF